MRRCVLNLLLLVAFFPAVLCADTINLGVFLFDNLIPDGSTPGVNVFDIWNFTGATWGSYADFPVSDELTLQNASVTLVGDLGTEQISLGDITPGIFTPPDTIEFTDTLNFTSATFTATLSEPVFNLYDGTTFVPGSQSITALIRPSSGDFLAAGTDFAIITASNVSAPEPSTLILGAMGSFLGAIWLSRRRLGRH